MADRTIRLILQAKVDGAINGMKTFASVVDKNRAAIDNMSQQAGRLGLAATAGVALAVKKFADFDKAMSSVKATGEDAAASIDALRQAAIDAGAETVFSATEAAGAIEEMAKAGVSAKDILAGGLKGALDLAAAGQLSVADAAGYAATAMTQFGLAGEDVGHVADLLAAGAGKAMGEVSDFGAALNQAGLVANATGLSIEETVGSLAAFASAGMIGSDAGTSLKTMLQRLSAPAGEAAGLMEQLGISAYDAAGNFVGMDAIAGQLQQAFADYTPEARNAAMATIFGSDAVRAANVLYAQGEDGIRGWTEAVDDQGFAADVAATKLDNLIGDLEGLGGAFETLLIGLGEGANGPLRWLVRGATDVVNSLAEMPEFLQSTLVLLTGAGGLGLLGVAALGKVATSVADGIAAFQTMKVAIDAAGGAMKLLGTGTVVGLALMAVVAGVSAVVENARKAREQVQAIADTMTDLGETTDETAEKIVGMLTIDRGDGSLVEGAALAEVSLSRVADAINLNEEAYEGLLAKQAEYNTQLADTTGLTASEIEQLGIKAGAIDKIIAVVDEERLTMEQAAEVARQRGEAEKATAEALGTAEDATTKAKDAVAGLTTATVEGTEATEGATEATDEHVESLEELIDTQREAAGITLSVRDAQRGFESALDAATEALKENGQTLDISTEKGRSNQAALDDIAKSGWELVESMAANGATQEELQAAMETSRRRFVDMAGAMGMGATEANELADELGLIPTKIDPKVTVTADTSAAYEKIATLHRDWNGRRIQMTVNATGTVSVSTGRQNMIARAAGGPVHGPGTSTSDSILARLSDGEYVVNAASAARNRRLLDQINYGQYPGFAAGFAGGGPVGGVPADAGARVVQHITVHYPIAEPTSVTTNRALQYAAAIGV